MKEQPIKIILALNLLLVFPLMLLSAPSETFELRINDVSGLDEPWPMIGGLPFPEGALHDADQIRIVDADSVETPAQIDVVSRWRDGSIRWAQAGLTASPQGDYRVEFGPGVSRRAPATPLRIDPDAAGGLSVDTGAAVYDFPPDRLLPETARMGDTVFLANAGDGAYLVDNRGRLARVAGEAAEIETRILKQGPMRTVIRSEGWYVTDDGAQIARARVWFYLSAGSPHLRITHSLVLTEDTNDLWIRDYGLAFNTPDAANEAVFALSESTEADRFHGDEAPAQQRESIADMFSSGLYEREHTLFTVSPDDNEVYMLQENYPHILERRFRAAVARAKAPLLPDVTPAHRENLWMHEWLLETEVAGDWAEARYGDHALMVVMPQLAQRFPKEIAVGPDGARVAFWSGRSGRDLDFRAVTLVNEYWKRWADNAVHAVGMFDRNQPNRGRGPEVGSRVAERRSNAQGAARTHDVWLLPRIEGPDATQLKARATAAAHPPLLQADPAWLGRSAAIGWPMHPKDVKRFPETEAHISDFWSDWLGGRLGHAEVRRTGFIAWGKGVTLGHGLRWFRLSTTNRYSLDRSAWQLYMRSGERRYYDYVRHFTRFAGDLGIHHWTTGNRFRGGFVNIDVGLPFYWEGRSTLSHRSSFWIFGWLMEYYLTGDEYAQELALLVADAFRTHAHPEGGGVDGNKFNFLFNLSVLYQHTGDETLRTIAERTAHTLMGLDNPVGLNDSVRYGVYYKTSPEWLSPLFFYYNATGDEAAREAILRAMDDKFRFFYSSNQTERLLLFAAVYRWTRNPAYLSLLNLMVEQPFFGMEGQNFLPGAPAALHVLANAEAPIDPSPVLAMTRDGNPQNVVRSDFTGAGILEHAFVEAEALPPIRVRKSANTPVNLSIFVQVADTLDENTAPGVSVTLDGATVDNARIVKTQRFKTRNAGRWYPRRWHVALSLPAELAAGNYHLSFPNVDTVVVLESDVPVTLLPPSNAQAKGES